MNFKKLISSAAMIGCAFLMASFVFAEEEITRVNAIYLSDRDIIDEIEKPEYPIEPLVDIEFEDYASDYGYNALGEEVNGTAKKALYNLIDTVAKKFHNSYIDISKSELKNDKEPDNPYIYYNVDNPLVFTGLSKEEAIAVWETYKNDHPLYYWISNSVLYTDTSLFLLTEEAYATGEERQRYNDKIEKELAEYLELAEDCGSDYQIALAYYDSIIDRIDYAYEEDGVTPEDDSWAHNILSVFDHEEGEIGYGVCEGYARTFQLLLNAAGVENIFVTGYAGEAHAWNLVQLEGQWYWCDATWDDVHEQGWGVQHTYFCLTDAKFARHTPNTPDGTGVNYLYKLPDRAAEPYKPQKEDGLLLGTEFTEGMLSYKVVGYHTVQVTAVNCEGGTLVIPGTVEHAGKTCTVVAVGAIGEDGKVGPIEWPYDKHPEKIILPASLRYIEPYTFYSGGTPRGIKVYEVEEGNRYFRSVDGVLFSENMETLLDYPDSREGTTYRVPAEVKTLGAFSLMNNRYLKKVELPDTLTSIEAEAFYECEALTDIDVYNTEDGMVIDSEYAVDLPDGLTELGAAAFADCQMIESVRIPEQITKLNGNTFFACFSLKEVVLPENLSEIGNKEFYYCRKLENVYFYGDVPEKWGEDVFVIDRFGNIPEELTLHYNLATTEKWTEGEWIGPDGVTYRTEASIVIENPDEPDKKPSILGDIDGDEKITTSDASAILRYIVGYVDDSVNIQYGDVDGDEKITTSDASAILRYIVGYEDNPGIGQAIEK